MYFIGKKSKDHIINISAKKIEKSKKTQKYDTILVTKKTQKKVLTSFTLHNCVE